MLLEWAVWPGQNIAVQIAPADARHSTAAVVVPAGVPAGTGTAPLGRPFVQENMLYVGVLVGMAVKALLLFCSDPLAPTEA